MFSVAVHVLCIFFALEASWIKFSFCSVDNMTQVLKEVVASQKFLSGLRGLSHYVELQRKQLERLRPIINKSFLSVDMAGRVVSAFSEEIWDHRVLLELKELIAAKSAECLDDTSRATLQDFCGLPCLLSKACMAVFGVTQQRCG